MLNPALAKRANVGSWSEPEGRPMRSVVEAAVMRKKGGHPRTDDREGRGKTVCTKIARRFVRLSGSREFQNADRKRGKAATKGGGPRNTRKRTKKETANGRQWTRMKEANASFVYFVDLLLWLR